MARPLPVEFEDAINSVVLSIPNAVRRRRYEPTTAAS
jgi:hypothetical protein